MSKPLIGIILVTFLRDEIFLDTLQTIINNLDENFIVFIGDQNPSSDKEIICNNLHPNIHYYHLPYDCGLSYSRNYLVDRAVEMNCNYCLITGDNIKFIKPMKHMLPILKFLEYDSRIGVVGLGLNYLWRYNLSIQNETFYLKKVNKPLVHNDIVYYQYDLIPNFFMAKTEVLLENTWDNFLKLTEHLDWMWRLKTTTSYQVYYTEYYSGIRKDKKTGLYKQYRDRHLTDEFRDIVRMKHGIAKGKWIHFE